MHENLDRPSQLAAAKTHYYSSFIRTNLENLLRNFTLRYGSHVVATDMIGTIIRGFCIQSWHCDEGSISRSVIEAPEWLHRWCAEHNIDRTHVTLLTLQLFHSGTGLSSPIIFIPSFF